jgi:hypothetical protein
MKESLPKLEQANARNGLQRQRRKYIEEKSIKYNVLSWVIHWLYIEFLLGRNVLDILFYNALNS